MKPTFKLLAILFLTFVIIIIYAVAFDKPKLFDDWGFKQIKLGDVTALADTAQTDTLAQVQEEEKKDTTNQRILFFGDSMTCPLSFRMRDWATANGHDLTTVCWYSSSTGTWAESDTLLHFMRKVKPTHVFICLGSNQLFVRDLDKVEEDMHTIIKKVGKIPTIWIGPPNWRKDTGINDLILKTMGKRAYYPSLNLTYERRKDGAHPTDASAAKWFDKIVEWMNEGNSIHPFRLDSVPDKKGKQELILLSPPGTERKPKSAAPAPAPKPKKETRDSI